MKIDSKIVLILSFFLIVLISSAILLIQFIPSSIEVNVKVGIVDSGCSQNQSSRVVEYETFTFRNYSFPVDENSVYDTIGHGTIICQIIIEESPNAEIFSAKVANSNGLLTYDALFAAVKYLVEEKKVDIINLSLGGEPYFTEELNSAFEEYADNVLIIAAVGNRGTNDDHSRGLVDWPASLPWVVGVGSGTNSLIDSYSSYGRTLNGSSVVEFVDNGQVGMNFGTSFSTPHVTAIFVNTLAELWERNLDPTPNELLYLGISNSKNQEFESDIGWGQLDPDAKIGIDSGILFEISDYEDPFLRFNNEQWDYQIKFYNHDFDLSAEDLDIKGNGSDFLSEIKIKQHNWGGLLSFVFDGTNKPGHFQIEVEISSQQIFRIHFNISSVNPKKMLFDHKFTVNGFAHEFGEYEFVSKFLRNHNILPVHSYYSDNDLSEYDYVFVTEMGKLIISDDRIFERDFQDEDFTNYLEYISNGGKLQIGLNYPDQFDLNQYNKSLTKLGIFPTGIEIPRSSGNSNVAAVTNLTRETNAYLENVNFLVFRGTGLERLNDTVDPMGWYEDSFFDGVTSGVFFIPIGYFGENGMGNYIVWSSNEMVKDRYFDTNGDNYDQFLINYLNSN